MKRVQHDSSPTAGMRQVLEQTQHAIIPLDLWPPNRTPHYDQRQSTGLSVSCA